MKYVISVSKTHKHRGKGIVHRANTKKHWQIMYYEFNEDENLQLYSKFVSPITAFYYKFHKYKKIHLTCPDCKTLGRNGGNRIEKSQTCRYYGSSPTNSRL